MQKLDFVNEVAESYVLQGKFATVEWHVESGGKPMSRGRCVGEGFPQLPDIPIYRIYSMTKRSSRSPQHAYRTRPAAALRPGGEIPAAIRESESLE